MQDASVFLVGFGEWAGLGYAGRARWVGAGQKCLNLTRGAWSS